MTQFFCSFVQNRKNMHRVEVHRASIIFFILFLPIWMISCNNTTPSSDGPRANEHKLDCVSGITEFKKGDIIVRPNINLLPGSALISGGANFGHAALVVKGFKHENPDSLLAGTIIVESIAKDVPLQFQVREMPALQYHRFAALNNDNFDKRRTGNRYRLRLQITDAQIDSLIAFALRQKGDYSSWNAVKARPPYLLNTADKAWADNTHWYCSLLVWQSVLATTGIDLDPNGGYMVYPNDLISSPIFKNNATITGRARF